MKYCKIPESVIRRLPKYMRYCTLHTSHELEYVTSSDIAGALDISPSLVRQDLSYFGAFGQQGIGYCVKDLYEYLISVFGIINTKTAILIGAKSFGRIILNSMRLDEIGYRLLAVFDESADEEIQIGEATVPVYNVAALRQFLATQKVDTCVIADHILDVQVIADTAISCGVQSFLNLTDDVIIAKRDIFIENINICDSMLRIKYSISN